MNWPLHVTLAGTFFAVAALAGLVGLWMFGGDSQTEQRLGELADPQSSLLRRRPRAARTPLAGRVQSLLASLGLRLLPAKGASHCRLQDQFLYAGMYAPSGPYVFTAVRFVLGLILPLLVLFVNPLFALAYFIDFPAVAVPVLYKGWQRGEFLKPLSSLPAYLVLRFVNASFILRAVWAEWIMRKSFKVYEKGH